MPDQSPSTTTENVVGTCNSKCTGTAQSIFVETSEEFPGFFDFIFYNGKVRAGVLQVQDDEVVYIWVKPSYRRKGIASALYEKACACLKKELVPLDVLNTTPAIGFWKSRGKYDGRKES